MRATRLADPHYTDTTTIYNMGSRRNTIDESPSIISILGEPCSKANSRQVVLIGGKVRVIKSKKARNYVKHCDLVIPSRKSLLEGDLFIAIKIYYKTRRPDLDESLILDVLQGKLYKNDRQIKAKYIEWGLDKENPRSIVCCGPLSEGATVMETLQDMLQEAGDGEECDGK